MSSPINKNEFIQGDLGLKELQQNFKKSLDVLKQFDDKIKSTANTLRTEYSGAQKVTIENLEKLNKVEQRSKKYSKKKRRIQRA